MIRRYLGNQRIHNANHTEKGHTLEFLEGDNRLLQMLVNCDWPKEDFLIIPPGHGIVGIYDHDIIMKST